MKTKMGRSSFRSNLKQAISARSNLLEDYFETKDQIFMTKNDDKVTLPLTSVVDINVLISLICEKRGLCENDIEVVFGIDGDQDKLIVIMVVAPIHEKAKQERLKEKEMKDRFKLSGIHKFCVLVRVDSFPENHFNIKILLDSLNLHELSKDFRISCDLKLIDILLGIQSCSSLHPCPYCEGMK